MRIWCLTGFICMFLLSLGDCIKCYYCNNGNNGACGAEFKTYQFEAFECPEENMKCGKQTQPPLESGWVGVFRTCYLPGTLPGINETNGCHHWTNPLENFTALFCFCDTDMCNGGNKRSPSPWILTPPTLLSAFILYINSVGIS